MNDIVFNWIRGDDEFETFIVTDDNDAPIDFTGSRFDLHIVSVRSNELIKLSTETGEITIEDNQVTFHVAHNLTKNATWTKAKWDLQQTTADNLVRTLCCGKIILNADVTRTT
ncbi:hypothetical protein D3M77_10925 [Rodentibacter pneumotropicus]|uniref:Uncharacterized protein n=2 Tax=Rodentibacter pneumotropicus TaxID=758 RepID=A0A4S2QJG9_9PAST|nr:hypothetical protein D3M77_10925 [Rodentibacter pneumotropicus]THA17389.1 hypothetical protein D3M76_01655 [Rodentibacter pneumotropicus]